MVNEWRLSVLLVAGVIGWAPACGSPSSRGPVTVRDSAGVTLVTTAEPAVRTPGMLGAPTLSIGSTGALLNHVVGAARLSDGRIVIADGGDSAVRFFSATGESLAEVGGPGDGPGEFRLLQSLGRIAGDTIWIYDYSHRRITFVSPRASVVREVELRPPLGSGLAVGVLRDGSIIVGESWSSGTSRSSGPGLSRDPVAYVRYSPAGTLVDTVALVPGREVLVSVEDGRGVMGAAPLGRRAVHALVGDYVAIGDQTDHEIRLLTPRGVVRRILRWANGDLQVSAELRQAWQEERLSDLPPGERPAAARALSSQPFPSRRPAYAEILATDSGGLWVADFAVVPDPTRWSVFDPDGGWQGYVSMPARFRPLQIGATSVLGVSRDEFDVERVELRPLRAR